jgi:hypothetical protein
MLEQKAWLRGLIFQDFLSLSRRKSIERVRAGSAAL